MRNWFSKVGRLVAFDQKNEHHSDFGFNQPSHPFALERIFHSHKCRTSKATSGSMKIVGNFENFWSPAIMGGSQPKRITCPCAFQIQALRLSLSDARELWKTRPQPEVLLARQHGPYWLLFSLSVSAQTARAPRPVPKSSTELVPTQRSTVRWGSHPTGTTRPADFSEENNRKRAKYKPNVQLYDEKHQPNPRFPLNRHNTTNAFFDERSSKCFWETWKK